MEQHRTKNPGNLPASAGALSATPAIEQPHLEGFPTGIAQQPDVSVCIVTFRTRDYLHACLESLYANTACSFEVIIVDNGSHDGTAEMLAKEFPEARFIENGRNDGYTRPMNQALRQGTGHHLLQLNPDTLVLPGAIDSLLDFLAHNPAVGICGPKVLNSDRSLQKSCRRGEPTPWAVITYFTGLSTLFPHSKRFGQYQLNYIGEDEIHPVAGLSGSCMLARRKVVEQIGYLDEQFFAYQEDTDFCHRARQAGWQVYYAPVAQIIHYGGMGGSRVQPYRSIFEWHRSYFRYYRKNLAGNYFFLFNWLYYLAMLLKLGITLLVNFMRNLLPGNRFGY